MIYKSITEVLNKTSNEYKDKIVFESKDETITYKEFNSECKNIGSFLIEKDFTHKNSAIFIDKSINCLLGMFGCAYANSCYTIIDVNSPSERINTILNTLEPECIITDKKNYDKCKDLNKNIYLIEDMIEYPINEEKLNNVLNSMSDTDPLYILFTSGSTGVPKGSVICNRSVIDYSDSICRTFDINSETIFGSQTPLYFSMSILDVFSTIYSGATFTIIPKMYFSFPVKLIEYLNEKKINTIYWVPSALGIVANFKTFDAIKPQYLNKVLFAGETMHTKILNVWIKNIPNCLFANLFGPTEITDTCTYYIVNREFKDTDSLPIGIPFTNCDVFAINEDNKLCKDDEIGEMYVRGSFLGLGYYNNPTKTSEAFVQNPLNDKYPETVYKTGDLVKLNEYGEYMYFGRKDFQIKHMGYRIELGEIETNISSIDGINLCACIYDSISDKIVLFYESSILSEEDIINKSNELLLSYMRPNVVKKLQRMPINANGKIDRVKLKEMEY